MEDQKSPTTSSDEEKDSKLSVSLALVQNSLATLAKEVKRSERRIQQAERKLQRCRRASRKMGKVISRVERCTDYPRGEREK